MSMQPNVMPSTPSTRNPRSAPPRKPHQMQTGLTPRLKPPLSAKPITKFEFTPHLKRPIPAKSFTKAKSVFKNFSLSKFAKGSLPANHVDERKDPASVHAVQRKIISQHIRKLNDSVPPNQGMTLAIATGEMKKLLPSYSEKSNSVELSDVLSLLTAKMRGTEFYSNGNPTLNRLTLQAQVDQIIQSIKQEVKK